MADNRIDKGLPNVTTDEPIIAPDDVMTEVDVTEEAKIDKPEIEVTPEEDGGATIDFDPSANLNIPGTENHFDNLAELLPDDILDPVGLKLAGDYQDYKSSRKDWEQAYVTGLDLLGFKYENRTQVGNL